MGWIFPPNIFNINSLAFNWLIECLLDYKSEVLLQLLMPKYK